MKFKYEIMQILLLIAAFIHILLGVVIIAIVVEDSLDTLIDIIIGGCWIFVSFAMSFFNKMLEDKIKEDNINNLNKQMKK